MLKWIKGLGDFDLEFRLWCNLVRIYKVGLNDLKWGCEVFDEVLKRDSESLEVCEELVCMYEVEDQSSTQVLRVWCSILVQSLNYIFVWKVLGRIFVWW